jgi:hypothetical protein
MLYFVVLFGNFTVTKKLPNDKIVIKNNVCFFGELQKSYKK